MGTKLNPGKFDCYEAAAPDEPMFVLLARDRLAPGLVAAWAAVRIGDPVSAMSEFVKMLNDFSEIYKIDPDTAKAKEAVDCADAMEAWRSQKDAAESLRDAAD